MGVSPRYNYDIMNERTWCGGLGECHNGNIVALTKVLVKEKLP
jgi:hypothetical protein